jgi:hypothetical protein
MDEARMEEKENHNISFVALAPVKDVWSPPCSAFLRNAQHGRNHTIHTPGRRTGKGPATIPESP